MLQADDGSSSSTWGPRSIRAVLIVSCVGWMVGLFLIIPPVLAWDNQAQPEAGSAPDRQAGQVNEPAAIRKGLKPELTPVRKRQVVVLTTMLIVVVLSVSLALLLWILWWSRRTHRLLREPLPATKRGDELWYLKAKSDPALTTELPAPDAPPDPRPS